MELSDIREHDRKWEAYYRRIIEGYFKTLTVEKAIKLKRLKITLEDPDELAELQEDKHLFYIANRVPPRIRMFPDRLQRHSKTDVELFDLITKCLSKVTNELAP